MQLITCEVNNSGNINNIDDQTTLLLLEPSTLKVVVTLDSQYKQLTIADNREVRLIVYSAGCFTGEINKYEQTFRNTVNRNEQQKAIDLHFLFVAIEQILALSLFNNQYYIESSSRLQNLPV